MKYIFSFILYLFSQYVYSQPEIRCMYSSKFTFMRGDEDIDKNTPIAACFNDDFFCFYTKETGTISFDVQGPILRESNNGFITTSFSNQEDKVRMKGYYDVFITYGKEKTIVINNSKSGTAITFSSKDFLGSASNEFIKNHIKLK